MTYVTTFGDENILWESTFKDSLKQVIEYELCVSVPAGSRAVTRVLEGREGRLLRVLEGRKGRLLRLVLPSGRMLTVELHDWGLDLALQTTGADWGHNRLEDLRGAQGWLMKVFTRFKYRKYQN